MSHVPKQPIKKPSKMARPSFLQISATKTDDRCVQVSPSGDGVSSPLLLGVLPAPVLPGVLLGSSGLAAGEAAVEDWCPPTILWCSGSRWSKGSKGSKGLCCWIAGMGIGIGAGIAIGDVEDRCA